jgi:hypothetical protein
MSKPFIHAQSSARKFGGKPEDYIQIHNLFDLSKGSIADSRHRCLTHQSWFIMEILERIKFSNSAPCTDDNRFITIINSDGKHISVRDIGEQHVLEDFGMRFIPTVQDYLENMEYKDWMGNTGKSVPPSFKKINDKRIKKEEDKKNNQKPEEIFYDKRPDKFKEEMEEQRLNLSKIIETHKEGEPFFIDKGSLNRD